MSKHKETVTDMGESPNDDSHTSGENFKKRMDHMLSKVRLVTLNGKLLEENLINEDDFVFNESEIIKIFNDLDFIRARDLAGHISNPVIRDKAIEVVNGKDVKLGLDFLSESPSDIYAAEILLNDINTQVGCGQQLYDQLNQAIKKARKKKMADITDEFSFNYGVMENTDEIEISIFRKFGDIDRFEKYVIMAIGDPLPGRPRALKNPRLFYEYLNVMEQGIKKYSKRGVPQVARALFE